METVMCGFVQADLVSSINSATVVPDPGLVNPWGVVVNASYACSSPLVKSVEASVVGPGGTANGSTAPTCDSVSRTTDIQTTIVSGPVSPWAAGQQVEVAVKLVDANMQVVGSPLTQTMTLK